MINNTQQHIYNTWLATTRKAINKPFRLRRDFSKLDETTKTSLLRLEQLFNKHKSIDMADFFVAPFKIYSDNQHIPIKWYTTMKAINIYKIHKNNNLKNKPNTL